MDCAVTNADVEDIINGTPQAIEKFLMNLCHTVKKVGTGEKKIETSPRRENKNQTVHKKVAINNQPYFFGFKEIFRYDPPKHLQNQSKDVIIMQLRETIEVIFCLSLILCRFWRGR